MKTWHLFYAAWFLIWLNQLGRWWWDQHRRELTGSDSNVQAMIDLVKRFLVFLALMWSSRFLFRWLLTQVAEQWVRIALWILVAFLVLHLIGAILQAREAQRRIEQMLEADGD